MILDNSIRFFGILDKNDMESISIVQKMLQDLRKNYEALNSIL